MIRAKNSIDCKVLETILLIARLGSFSEAARTLNTTQPAISLRIAEAETSLGILFFDRSGRRAVLTPEGRLACDYAERILSLRGELVDKIGDPAARRGTLRLGVSETIVHTWLPIFLEKFSATYPGLTLELDVDISTELRTFLLQGRIDLAFMVGPAGVPELQARPLCHFPVGFIASPALDLPKRKIGVEDLNKHPILTFARGTLPYAEVAGLFAHSDGSPPRIFASASMATLVRMALDGIGIAAIPPAIVNDDIAKGRLIRLQTRHRLRDLDFVAMWAETSERLLISRIADLAAETAQQ